MQNTITLTPVSGSCSTPWGVSAQHESYSLSHSLKEDVLPQTELGNLDTGQLGPANSTRVFNRLTHSPHQSYQPPPIGQTCPGYFGGTKTIERGSSGIFACTESFISHIFLVEKEGGDNVQYCIYF